MNPEAVLEAARRGRLYPSVILYGIDLEGRRQAAVEIARTLLCKSPAGHRPCSGADPCRNCRRIGWPPERFHPDLHVLERDLRTSTSIAATKSFLTAAYQTPFEARGQVFVVAEADSLSGGAADALLKLLEEPPESAPRHFLLLAASRLDLLPTLRSRSLAVYLGPSEGLDAEDVASIAGAFGRSIERYAASPSPIYLLTAGEALAQARGWKDPRARRPWATAAAAVLRYLQETEVDASLRRALLALAQELLDAPQWRLRGITHLRILEGLLARHLAAA